MNDTATWRWHQVYVFVVSQQFGNHLHDFLRVIFDGVKYREDEHTAVSLNLTPDQWDVAM